MYDAKKVIPGIIIFLALLTLPFWYSQATGKADEKPNPVILPEAGSQCVESAAWMRENHMKLLNDWRNSVVQHDNRVYISKDGEEWVKSLSATGAEDPHDKGCLDCHSNVDQFCIQCHDFVDADPDCYDCHVK